jgi:hypothetical protein
MPRGTYLAQILGVCHYTVELHTVSLRNMMLCNTTYAVWTLAVNPNLNIAALWTNNLEGEPWFVQFDSRMPSRSRTPLLLYNTTNAIFLISIYY